MKSINTVYERWQMIMESTLELIQQGHLTPMPMIEALPYKIVETRYYVKLQEQFLALSPSRAHVDILQQLVGIATCELHLFNDLVMMECYIHSAWQGRDKKTALSLLKKQEQMFLTAQLAKWSSTKIPALETFKAGYQDGYRVGLLEIIDDIMTMKPSSFTEVYESLLENTLSQLMLSYNAFYRRKYETNLSITVR